MDVHRADPAMSRGSLARRAGRGRLVLVGLLPAVVGACGGDKADDGANGARPTPTSTAAGLGPGTSPDPQAINRGSAPGGAARLPELSLDRRPTGDRADVEGLAGSRVELADGRTVVADRGYLIRSILEPDVETVAGFPSGVMAGAIAGRRLTATEVSDIVSYLESLNQVRCWGNLLILFGHYLLNGVSCATEAR